MAYNNRQYEKHHLTKEERKLAGPSNETQVEFENNERHQEAFGKPLNPTLRTFKKYTDEAFGMAYLYRLQENPLYKLFKHRGE